MAAKLDQSLDDIMKVDRTSNAGRGRGRGRNRGRVTTAKTTKAAGPAGGITKVVTTKTGKRGGKGGKATSVTTRVTTTKPAPASLGSKIVVSNLPTDISDAQIKEYFAKTVGQVKSTELSYKPTGGSRGAATITFYTSDGANKAAKAMSGVKVDGRPMMIEIVVGAGEAPAPKSLGDRIVHAKPATAGKNAPKAAVGKNAAKGAQKGAAGKGRAGAKGGRGKASKKSAAELDAEMTDYFGNGQVNGAQAAAAANGGDVGMVDEVM